MAEEQKKDYDPEMRGALYEEKDRKSENSPISTGKVTISGLELRIAMWPSRMTKGGNGQQPKKYWPLKVEYRQGTKFVLARVNPKDITVAGTAAAAGSEQAAAPASADTPGEESTDVSDMPF